MDGYDPYLVCVGAYIAIAQVAGTDQTVLKWLQAYVPVKYRCFAPADSTLTISDNMDT